MKNHKGKTVQERITEGINYIEQLNDVELKQSFIIKLLGVVDFAVEFKLIEYDEWEQYINKIFNIDYYK